MGKKKRGGNKKKKAGGRGGAGSGNPTSDTTRKQYCGRREVSPSDPVVDDCAIASEDSDQKVEAETPTTGEVQNEAPRDDGQIADDSVPSNETSDVLQGKEEESNNYGASAAGGGEQPDGDVALTNAAIRDGFDCTIDTEDVPLSGEKEDDPTQGTEPLKVDLIPCNDEVAETAAAGEEQEEEDIPTENKADDVVETEEVASNEVSHDPSHTESREMKPISCDDIDREQANSCTSDREDAKVQPAKDSGEDDSMPTPGVAAYNEDNGVMETVIGDDDSTSEKKQAGGAYVSQLSVRMESMEEVDLDAPPEENEPSSPPLVRAYDGTPNGISPATHSSMSFTFRDSTESEAFVFLTASLREELSGHANIDASDETLGRFLRWKPDVKRAAERFRAYQTFRTENAYVFDDLLLSRSPELTYLLQNGFAVAPEELVAKDGSAVVVLRGSKCDIATHGYKDEVACRAIFYVLQKVMERLDPVDGISIVLDLAGVTRKNVPKRLSKLLAKAAGCFPLRIRAICVVAMPWWFPSGNAKLFSAKMRSRIVYLKKKAGLSDIIDKDRLLEEDGGIYNFDLHQWINSIVLQEVEHL